MTGQEKFDTCRNRSDEIHNTVSTAQIGCGGCFKGRTAGYFCWVKEINPVVPEICEGCKSYAARGATSPFGN